MVGMPPYVPSFAAARAERRRLAPLPLCTIPLVAAWIGAPHVAHALSAPALRRACASLPRSVRSRCDTRSCMAVFERFVSDETRGLAPTISGGSGAGPRHRTSPTNIGLQLFSIVSAYDLGSSPQRDDRAPGGAFRSLERMRRFRGHFYNWYELSDLRVLEPAYVSTVDSGNLAGCLLAVKQACLLVADEPVFDPRVYEAIQAALTLAEDGAKEPLAAGRVGDPVAWRAVTDATRWARSLRATLGKETTGDDHPSVLLLRVAKETRETADALRRASATREALAKAVFWLEWAATLAERHAAELGQLGAGASPRAPVQTLISESSHVSEQVAGSPCWRSQHDYAMEMDSRFLSTSAGSCSRSDTTLRAAVSTTRSTICSRRSAARDFIAIAKDDVPGTVFVEPHAHAAIRRNGAGLVSGACSSTHAADRHAVLSLHPARSDVSGCRAPPHEVRRAWRSLGNLGVGVQPP